MSLIPDYKRDFLRNEFKEKLVNLLKILVFTQEVECDFCANTRQLAQELAVLSDKIAIEVYDFMADAAKAKEYGVDKIRALSIIGEKDYGVRIYGIPYGYEFQTLVEVVIHVSRGKTAISEKTRAILSEVKAPVHIQVFVSLTCPHCPEATTVAHKLSIESDLIHADVIDGSEFPHLAQKYDVIGVPKVIINEKIEFVGAFSEDLFAEHVLLGAF